MSDNPFYEPDEDDGDGIGWAVLYVGLIAVGLLALVISAIDKLL